MFTRKAAIVTTGESTYILYLEPDPKGHFLVISHLEPGQNGHGTYHETWLDTGLVKAILEELTPEADQVVGTTTQSPAVTASTTPTGDAATIADGAAVEPATPSVVIGADETV